MFRYRRYLDRFSHLSKPNLWDKYEIDLKRVSEELRDPYLKKINDRDIIEQIKFSRAVNDF